MAQQDYKVILSAEDAGLKGTMQQSQQSMDQFADSVSDVGDSIQATAQDIVQGMSSMNNFKREMRTTTAELLNLEHAWSNMDDAAKSSDVGRELAQKLEEVRERAGQLRDEIADTNATITALASDTANIDAAKQGVEMLRDSFSALTAVMSLTGGENKSLDRLMKTLATTYTVATTAITLMNAVQKQSAIMLGVSKVQRLAEIAAINMQTAATGRATAATVAMTAAQSALNLVAKANPYVLLFSTLAAGIGILFGISQATEDYAEKQDAAAQKAKEQEEAEKHAKEEMKRAQEEYTSSISRESAKLIVSYSDLKDEYTSLKTAVEKRQFVRDHASDFQQLGLNINDVISADNAFVQNSDNVIRALELRAQAMALQNLQMNAYTRYFNEMQKMDELPDPTKNFYKKGDWVPNEDIFKAGVKRSQASLTGGETIDSQQTIDKINEYKYRQEVRTQENIRNRRQAELQKELNFSKNKMKEIVDEQNKLVGNLIAPGNSNVKKQQTKTNTKSESKTDKQKPLTGSIDALNEERQKLEKSLTDGTYTKAGTTAEDVRAKIRQIDTEINAQKVITKDVKFNIASLSDEDLAGLYNTLLHKKFTLGIEVDDKAIEDIEKELDRRQFIANVEMKLDPKSVSIADAQKQQSEISTKLMTDTSLADEDIKKLADRYKELKEFIEQRRIELGLSTDPAEAKLTALEERYKKITKPEEQSSYEKAVPKEVDNSAEGQLAALKQVMDANDAQLAQLRELQDEYSKLGEKGAEGYQQVTEKINELSEAQEQNADKAKELDKEDKKTKKRKKNYDEMMDAVGGMGDAFSALGQLTDDETFNTAGIIAQTIANIGLGLSNIMSHPTTAALGPWGYIAFGAAALAQTIGMIASIKSATSAASGAIVPGTSYTGDKVWARVNSSEMILNNSQQGRLWRMINGQAVAGPAAGGPQEVSFVIRGSDLYGALKNFSKQQAKVGKITGIH